MIKLHKLECRKCKQEFYVNSLYKYEETLKYGRHEKFVGYKVLQENCDCDKSYVEDYFQKIIKL